LESESSSKYFQKENPLGVQRVSISGKDIVGKLRISEIKFLM
jgi:hypothetical protein